MMTMLVVCACICTLTGVRTIWSAIFGARRKPAAVPGARVVRDAKGEVAEASALPAIARVIGGVFLIVIGIAVLYIVERTPR
jgi:hypothetical protein